MAWAKGETLGEFLEVNRRSAQAIAKLSASIESLAAYLEKEKIAHGDFQTGNLMVSDGGATVQLIDYDGMFVDEIKTLGSSELGHVNFQHPRRKATNPFNHTLIVSH
jgi:tRNA A-37 threonylcarbamoyl transferase component Bud32